MTLERALYVFVSMRSSDEQAVSSYRMQINNVKLITLVVGQAGLGFLVIIASQLITTIPDELCLAFLSVCNKTLVPSFCCIADAACLMKIGEILYNTCAFPNDFDSTTVNATSYFDVRLGCVREKV